MKPCVRSFKYCNVSKRNVVKFPAYPIWYNEPIYYVGNRDCINYEVIIKCRHGILLCNFRHGYCILNFARHSIFHVGIVRHGIEADMGCNMYMYMYMLPKVLSNKRFIINLK